MCELFFQDYVRAQAEKYLTRLALIFFLLRYNILTSAKARHKLIGSLPLGSASQHNI